MNRASLRSPARSLANLEFHHTGDQVNDVARRIVAQLEQRGIGAINPAMGFSMEMDRFPGKIWVVSHKPMAVAAGLGSMGIHRKVMHPRFGNFILLGTVLMSAAVSAYQQPLDYNPCLECKLCMSACPVGAVGADGSFNFSACYTHNYREFMGGFTNWVEEIADQACWQWLAPRPFHSWLATRAATRVAARPGQGIGGDVDARPLLPVTDQLVRTRHRTPPFGFRPRTPVPPNFPPSR